MDIMLCIPDKSERDFCLKHLPELAAQANVKWSIIQKNTSSELLFYLEDMREVDLVYIGIQELSFDGIELAAKMREYGIMADIVFFTKDERRMSEAFDVEALHYLVSGKISKSKFDDVFRKALVRSMRRSQDVITFSCAGEWRQVPIASIRYFEVKNRIITVYYENRQFEFYSTLSRIEEKLYGRRFVRIHRSILVSKSFIESVTPSSVTLTDGTILPVGRQYADNLQQRRQYADNLQPREKVV